MVKVALKEKEWIELPKGSKQGLYIDGYHKGTLDTARKIIKADWDMVFVYDGFEGTGKSVKAMQDAFYCDPTLTIDRITFNPEDFKAAIEQAKPYQAVVLDEAYGGLSSRGAMGSINKSIVQMLTVIREKNLFIFIVLPTFFDLDKYVALWRSRALIHVYTGKNFERGFFEFYNKDRKKNLYVLGKKLYDYSHQKPNYRGSFTNTYVVDEELYRTKKRETSMGKDDEGLQSNDPHLLQKAAVKVRTEIINSLNEKEFGLTKAQKASILNIAVQTMNRYLREAKANEKIDEDIELELKP